MMLGSAKSAHMSYLRSELFLFRTIPDLFPFFVKQDRKPIQEKNGMMCQERSRIIAGVLATSPNQLVKIYAAQNLGKCFLMIRPSGLLLSACNNQLEFI